jgi:hypothetical protein
MVLGKKRVQLFTKSAGSLYSYLDDDWFQSFYHLLLEMFELWNEKSSSPRPVMPIDFHKIYLNLTAAGVSFPKSKKYIDWPKSCARTTEASSEVM